MCVYVQECNVLGFYTKRNLTRQIEFKFSQVVVVTGHKRAYVKTLIDYVQQGKLYLLL